MMNYRKVEAAREVRLWIEHVIFPTAIVVGIALHQYFKKGGKY